jgi:hypothetical protein
MLFRRHRLDRGGGPLLPDHNAGPPAQLDLRSAVRVHKEWYPIRCIMTFISYIDRATGFIYAGAGPYQLHQINFTINLL